MSTDNRTTLNDCSAVTGWTGDDAVTVTTLTGQFYEGGSSLSTQLSNSDEHMYTTSIGGTRDLSDATCYLLVKDNLVDTIANGGVKYVLHDGTNRIGYEVGGNDQVGLPLTPFFNAYKLDVSNSAALTFFTFAGTEANLTETAITGVGFGSLHLAKAQGAIDNVFMDRFSFIANGSAALTVNGGTSGTPETSADVAGDDITNGWGMVSNPQGDQYNWFAPTEFGDATTLDSYFDVSNEQWYLLGQGIGATHFNFSLIANSTGTNSFAMTNVVMVGLGTRANWDLAPANHDTMKLTNVTFTDIGTITFPTQSIGNKFANNCIFNNCDRVDLQSIDADGCTFNGTTDANGAIIWDENTTDVSNQDNMTFNSDGTGHAIEVAPTGAGTFTYNIDGYNFTGYATDAGTSTDRVFFINPSTLSANITINLSNSGSDGSGFSARTVAGYTGTLTINASVPVSVKVIDKDGVAIQGAQVSMYLVSDDSQVMLADTNASGIASTNFSGTTPADVYYRVRKASAGDTKYVNDSALGTIESGTGLSVTRTLRVDPNNNS